MVRLGGEPKSDSQTGKSGWPFIMAAKHYLFVTVEHGWGCLRPDHGSSRATCVSAAARWLQNAFRCLEFPVRRYSDAMRCASANQTHNVWSEHACGSTAASVDVEIVEWRNLSLGPATGAVPFSGGSFTTS